MGQTQKRALLRTCHSRPSLPVVVPTDTSLAQPQPASPMRELGQRGRMAQRGPALEPRKRLKEAAGGGQVETASMLQPRGGSPLESFSMGLKTRGELDLLIQECERNAGGIPETWGAQTIPDTCQNLL